MQHLSTLAYIIAIILFVASAINAEVVIAWGLVSTAAGLALASIGE